MDRREAKEILARYRPGATLGDPKIGEALELAQRDPQLAEWLAKHTAAQAANAGGGVAVSAPEQAASTGKADQEDIIPLTKPALIIIGVVLVVMLAALLGPFLAGPRAKDPFISYRDRMARLVQRGYPMKNFATEQAQMRDYFRTNGGPVDFPLPRSLEKLPGKGCAVFTWYSNPVALMGFDAGTNMNLFLFMISRTAFEHPPVSTQPEFARVGRLLTASWVVGDRIYVLAGTNDAAVLRNYTQMGQ